MADIVKPHVTSLSGKLTTEDVARLTGRKNQTLRKDRSAGQGIPFVRLGRLIRYQAEDVTRYIEANRVDVEKIPGPSAPLDALDKSKQ